MRQWLLLLPLSLAPLLLAGCKRDQPAGPQQGKLEVRVSYPKVEPAITDYEFFTGRTEALQRADLRARVTGHLVEIKFKDGDIVKKDQVLFVIDQRLFKAAVENASASLAQEEAHFKRVDADFVRAGPLFERGAIGKEDYEKYRGDREESMAAVKKAKAALVTAEENLNYTVMRAPFTGRISRRLIDRGNLVKQDETILTTIVDLEKTYAYFDVDERTLLRQLVSTGALESARASASKENLKIDIGLADETGYPHRGTIDFVDNVVDPNTGTMWMRGIFDKPEDGKEQRAVPPGVFIRVRFPVGKPHPAVLVPEQAINTDQGEKFVFVVDAQEKAQYRKVTVGRLDEGLRVIKGKKFSFIVEAAGSADGKTPPKYRLIDDPKKKNDPQVIHSDLKPDERVIVSGLQRVKAKMDVKPRVVPVDNGSSAKDLAGKDKSESK